MSIFPTRLFDSQQLGVAAATLFTSKVNIKTIIKKLTFCNTTTSARLVTVYLIKSGGTAGDDNTILKTVTVGPLQTMEAFVTENHILMPADFIQAKCDAATAVTAMGSGIEITT